VKNIYKPADKYLLLYEGCVADPDPQDPYVFEPPGSGSKQLVGTMNGSGSFYHQAKKVRKTLIHTVL
jgi:hypothetical protein